MKFRIESKSKIELELLSIQVEHARNSRELSTDVKHSGNQSEKGSDMGHVSVASRVNCMCWESRAK